MKKTLVWLLIGTFVVQVILGLANYNTIYSPTPAEATGLGYFLRAWLRDNARGIIFSCNLLLAGITLAKDLPRILGWRREKAQEVLDKFAADNWPEGAEANLNRITLFRACRGWHALMGGLWVLRWLPFRESKRYKRKALWRVEWMSDYVTVYARSSQSRTRYSCACFRVADKEEHCEGFCGRVWIQRFQKEPDLPLLRAGSLRGIESVSALPAGDERRLYAEKLNVSDPRLLDAMDTYSRHYMGHIVSVGGKPWGVLILDSSAPVCPWREKKSGLERDFKELAKQLSHVI